MSLVFKRQSVLEAPPGSVIAHGVNRRLAMGKGVALAIKEKWPQVYEVYRADNNPVPPLGSARFIPIEEDGVVIANLYTQDNYALTYTQGGVFADLDAVCTSIITAHRYVIEHELLQLAIPRIGCGLGGLSWEDNVLPFLQAYSAVNDNVPIVVYEP